MFEVSTTNSLGGAFAPPIPLIDCSCWRLHRITECKGERGGRGGRAEGRKDSAEARYCGMCGCCYRQSIAEAAVIPGNQLNSVN